MPNAARDFSGSAAGAFFDGSWEKETAPTEKNNMAKRLVFIALCVSHKIKVNELLFILKAKIDVQPIFTAMGWPFLGENQFGLVGFSPFTTKPRPNFSHRWKGNVQLLYNFRNRLKDGVPEKVEVRFGMAYQLFRARLKRGDR